MDRAPNAGHDTHLFASDLLERFRDLIIMQRVLVREKQQGTAAWVLSKPVTRTAFVISRLTVNSIAILLTAALAASFLPAWRASRISPIRALRYE